MTQDPAQFSPPGSRKKSLAAPARLPLPLLPTLLALSLLAALLAARPAAAALSFEGPEGAVNSLIELDRTAIPAGRPDQLYVIVRLRAPQDVADGERPRPPLNLALVLDRSGSMESKGKMDYLKAAARDLIDRLAPGDRLAIVEYDDRITVAAPSAPVRDRAALKRVIDGLEPRGSTNLAGGLLAGLHSVAAHYDSEAVNRVLLLSDGLANVGLTTTPEIRNALLRGTTRRLPVTTLGLGLDYNEDLMQDVAEYTGGAYHYIESPHQMADVFARELSALMDTVAGDMRLEFRPGGAVSNVTVFGYPSHRQGATTVIPLPDLYAGQERTITLRLDVAGQGQGSVSLGQLDLAYRDVKAEQPVHTSQALSVLATTERAVLDTALNREAKVEATLAEVESRHQQALEKAQAGRWDEAQADMAATARELEDVNQDLDDARLSDKMEALKVEEQQVGAAAAAPASASSKMFMKRSKNRLYQAYQGERGGYVLSPGDSGPQVEDLQNALSAAGLYTGPADGVFSPDLENAVRTYQTNNGLDTDGRAGPQTLNSLGLY
ncbi:peptidoglycan-binding protein [Roseospirillum parvum]|uniref:Ca-activated chloride channel family protein n=1 Tax=Roseospirillum parvum TaxID=83401 RepID=A0A1G7VD66_9PROT|nr:peptidoglycan-binding protein [Roseospirillum parvum]SDG57299.1 Ca-activated chloride channel family protein [Roseospirillum parvum]